ncbi:MAG: TM2 domain-containing protein [Micromonosporaceae bacterium]|nr:TM2 domain-containing protein [Micromonosporaceae bacterium]
MPGYLADPTHPSGPGPVPPAAPGSPAAGYPSAAEFHPAAETYAEPAYQAPTYPPPGAAGYGAGYAPPAYDPLGRPYSDKSKMVAGLLGIFLGGLGVGRFYTGHTGLGVAQLIVSICTLGVGSIWGLVDGIIILINGGTDAQGRVLRD